MSRRTQAAAAQQPDLLTGGISTTAKEAAAFKTQAPKRAQAVAVRDAKPKNGVAHAGEPRSMLEVIAEATTNKDVDVEKMRALLEMQREIEHREEVRLYNAALMAVQDEVPPLAKDGKNTHTSARYPTLENVSRSLNAIARKHGFVMSWGTADSPLKDHYRVVCDLSHSGGDARRHFVDLKIDTSGPSGTRNKTDIQGISSSISFGRRILKILMFDLTVVGEDKDGNGAAAPARNSRRQAAAAPAEPETIEGAGVELITDDQATTLIDAIEAAGRTRKAFCTSWQIDKVANLESRHYDTAMQALKKLAGA